MHLEGGTTSSDAAKDAAGGQGGSHTPGTGGVLTGAGAAVGTGGILGAGGQIGSGGRLGTGGSSGRGGSPGTGGTLGTGGSLGTGGRLGTGGSGTGGSGTGGSGTVGSGTVGSGTGGTLDTAGTTIFVAPQGYTDASPWRVADDKDHAFFENMVTLFESELCIDISRIFAVGFSFGAMFANSLAQNHQKLLRGVVVYETAVRNIYLPLNTGEPLAWWGMVGMEDPICRPDDGRAARDRFVANNGCTVPASVPEAGSGGSHVCYDYYGCGDKHPVTWCTFDGGHMDYPMDPGQTTTWVPAATWGFITQF